MRLAPTEYVTNLTLAQVERSDLMKLPQEAALAAGDPISGLWVPDTARRTPIFRGLSCCGKETDFFLKNFVYVNPKLSSESAVRIQAISVLVAFGLAGFRSAAI